MVFRTADTSSLYVAQRAIATGGAGASFARTSVAVEASARSSRRVITSLLQDQRRGDVDAVNIDSRTFVHVIWFDFLRLRSRCEQCRRLELSQHLYGHILHGKAGIIHELQHGLAAVRDLRVILKHP